MAVAAEGYRTPQWKNGTLKTATADGNKWNLSLSFFANDSPSKTNPVRGPQFSGKRWAAGEKVPTDPNIFGQTEPASDPDSTGGLSADLQKWKTLAINAAVAGMKVAKLNCIKKFIAWTRPGSQVDKEALGEA